jgi:hypothetical protein
MSSALDRFEQSLVRASTTLHQQHVAGTPAASAEAVGVDTLTRRRPSRLRTAIGRHRWHIPAGALAIGVLAAAGTSLLGATGNPREIPQIQCGERGSSEFVTGEPVRDCATLWPSLYHHPAPALVAWVAETGGVVVVTPADRPPRGGEWRRLPSGWTADSAVLQLHTQLEDITTGIEAHSCWSAPAASALVASILRADGLGSWHVRVKTERANGAHPNCLLVSAATGADTRSVLLVERPVQEPAGSPRTFPSGADEHERLTSTETRVNSTLSAAGRCASVAQAAALWRSSALAAGIPTARYVLFTQPTAHRTTSCARVFVNTPGGGGPADVYAAELP